MQSRDTAVASSGHKFTLAQPWRARPSSAPVVARPVTRAPSITPNAPNIEVPAVAEQEKVGNVHAEATKPRVVVGAAIAGGLLGLLLLSLVSACLIVGARRQHARARRGYKLQTPSASGGEPLKLSHLSTPIEAHKLGEGKRGGDENSSDVPTSALGSMARTRSCSTLALASCNI
jgi:hypothetical protein